MIKLIITGWQSISGGQDLRITTFLPPQLNTGVTYVRTNRNSDCSGGHLYLRGLTQYKVKEIWIKKNFFFSLLKSSQNSSLAQEKEIQRTLYCQKKNSSPYPNKNSKKPLMIHQTSPCSEGRNQTLRFLSAPSVHSSGQKKPTESKPYFFQVNAPTWQALLQEKLTAQMCYT